MNPVPAIGVGFAYASFTPKQKKLFWQSVLVIFPLIVLSSGLSFIIFDKNDNKRALSTTLVVGKVVVDDVRDKNKTNYHWLTVSYAQAGQQANSASFTPRVALNSNSYSVPKVGEEIMVRVPKDPGSKDSPYLPLQASNDIGMFKFISIFVGIVTAILYPVAIMRIKKLNAVIAS
jgi:hypothetical protein